MFTPSGHTYTATIAWPADDVAEEVDFTAPGHATADDLERLAVAAVESFGYLAGWAVVGIVDQTTGDVMLNRTGTAPTTGLGYVHY